MRFNGDLVPISSGVGDIGQTEVPVIKVFQESGVFYSLGLSGIIRFDGAQEKLQGSNDGGASFFNITAGVDSINVIGYADLTGDIALSSPSGYIILGQTGQTITADVDVVGLSGFYGLKSFDNMVKGYQETIAVAATTWTINHNLNTTKVIPYAWDDSGNPLGILPDDFERTTVNQIKVYFNSAQAGEIVIMGF